MNIFLTAFIVFALFIFLTLDWFQTLEIAKNPGKWDERWNLVLSKNPTVAQVDGYFALCLAIFCLCIYAISVHVVGIVAAPFLLLELACTLHNYKVGIRIGHFGI